MVSCFAANNTKALIDLRDEDVYARRLYVAMADLRHGLAPCNTNKFVVDGQEQLWVPVFLIRISGTL